MHRVLGTSGRGFVYLSSLDLRPIICCEFITPATYKNPMLSTDTSGECEIVNAESKTSMSTQEKALACFKTSVPMDVV